MELTQMQLYEVAGRVDPDDWVNLGIRLGFEFNHIKQMKEGCKGVIPLQYFLPLSLSLSLKRG